MGYLAHAEKLNPSFVAEGSRRTTRVDETSSADTDDVSEADLT
jgi:hypothetical protein